MIDQAVRQVLRCPVCRGDLADLGSDPLTALACATCAVTYPVRDGIAILLSDEAEALV